MPTKSLNRMKIAFVCVQNAGRSQMAAAFGRALAPKGVEIISGGTSPADRVNPIVAEAMRERGIDISKERPRAVTPRELEDADYVITMGCSAGEVCPATFRGDARDWALPDPKGRGIEEVRTIRNEIQRRVVELMEEIREKSGSGPNGVGPRRDSSRKVK